MKKIIDGEPVDAADGAVIEVVNPANGKLLDKVPAATKSGVGTEGVLSTFDVDTRKKTIALKNALA